MKKNALLVAFSFGILLLIACNQRQDETSYEMENWNLNVEGFSAAYFDDQREAFAVNTIEQPTDRWAAAESVFPGEAGIYTMIFTSRQETDGESAFKVLVNGREVLIFNNPRIFGLNIPEYEPYTLMVKNIALQNGDQIRVAFFPHSNGLVPEDDAFGFARARWNNVIFVKEK